MNIVAIDSHGGVVKRNCVQGAFHRPSVLHPPTVLQIEPDGQLSGPKRTIGDRIVHTLVYIIVSSVTCRAHCLIVVSESHSSSQAGKVVLAAR